MSRLTDDELAKINRRFTGADHEEVESMVAEIRQHRASRMAHRERVRAVVEGELAKCGIQPASNFRQVRDDGVFSGRVADEISGLSDGDAPGAPADLRRAPEAQVVSSPTDGSTDLTEDELRVACTASDRLVQLNQIAYVMPEALASAAMLQRAALEIQRLRVEVAALSEAKERHLGLLVKRVRSVAREVTEYAAHKAIDGALGEVSRQVGHLGHTLVEARGVGMLGVATDAIAARVAERLAGSECEHCKDGWPTRKCVVSGDIIHRGPEFSSRCTAQPPSEATRSVVLSDDEMTDLESLLEALKDDRQECISSGRFEYANIHRDRADALEKLIAAHRRAP